MKLKINGLTKIISPSPNPPTLMAVIKELGHDPRLVVVEYNGKILSQATWENQIVASEDCLEIVTIVGGGS